jgi:hypothetical protein
MDSTCSGWGQWQGLVNTAVNFWVLIKGGEFVNQLNDFSLSGKPVS